MLKIFGVNFVWFWRYVGIKDWHKRLFSCPEQLNRWPCHSLTDWLTHSLTFTFAMQRIILETCGHWGIWSEWWGDMIFMTLSTLSTFCLLIILRQILTIWRTVWETWHLRHRLQFWRLRTWIQSIIVTWQLIVTLDSIHNSCDVLRMGMSKRRGGDEDFRRSWQSFQSYKSYKSYKSLYL